MFSLILPTFNEAESLPRLLPQIDMALKDHDYEVLVVDDNSPDKTWEIAENLKKHHPHLRVIRRIGEKEREDDSIWKREMSRLHAY